MLARLRKLASFGAREWRDLARAQLALLRARRRYATEPIGGIVARGPGGTSDVAGDSRRAFAIALAVSRSARFGLFRPYCVVRALALRELLEREGITGSTIRVGVRRREGAFEAHAWVMWGTTLLDDVPAHVASFTEVDDLRVVMRA